MNNPNLSPARTTNDSPTQELAEEPATNNDNCEEDIEPKLPSFPNVTETIDQDRNNLDGQKLLTRIRQQPSDSGNLSMRGVQREYSLTAGPVSQTGIARATDVEQFTSEKPSLGTDIAGNASSHLLPGKFSDAHSPTHSMPSSKLAGRDGLAMPLASQPGTTSLLKSLPPEYQAAAANLVNSQKLLSHPSTITESSISGINSSSSSSSRFSGLGDEAFLSSFYGSQNPLLGRSVDATTALLLRHHEQQRALRLHQLSQLSASTASVSSDVVRNLYSNPLSSYLRLQRNAQGLSASTGPASDVARQNENALLTALDFAPPSRQVSAAQSAESSVENNAQVSSIDGDLLSHARTTIGAESEAAKKEDSQQGDHGPEENTEEEEENISDGSDSDENKRKGGVAEPFPRKLHRMLLELEAEKKDDIISFFPHGRAFAIHKPRNFIAEVMPRYFRMSRLSSFQRQLNLYSFKRITEGRDKGGYYHELFIKEKPHLCKKLRRTKPKKKQTALSATWNPNPTGLGSFPYSGTLPSLARGALGVGSNAFMLPSLGTERLLERELLQSRLLAANNAFGGVSVPGIGGLPLRSALPHPDDMTIRDLLLRANPPFPRPNIMPNSSSTSVSSLSPAVALALLGQQHRNTDALGLASSPSQGTGSTQSGRQDSAARIAAARRELGLGRSENFSTPKTRDQHSRRFSH